MVLDTGDGVFADCNLCKDERENVRDISMEDGEFDKVRKYLGMSIFSIDDGC